MAMSVAGLLEAQPPACSHQVLGVLEGDRISQASASEKVSAALASASMGSQRRALVGCNPPSDAAPVANAGTGTHTGARRMHTGLPLTGLEHVGGRPGWQTLQVKYRGTHWPGTLVRWPGTLVHWPGTRWTGKLACATGLAPSALEGWVGLAGAPATAAMLTSSTREHAMLPARSAQRPSGSSSKLASVQWPQPGQYPLTP
jgi:hypothetical protein